MIRNGSRIESERRRRVSEKTDDFIKLLKSIYAEIVRSNDMREALSPVDSQTLAIRIEQIKSRREKAELNQRQLEAAAAAIVANEKGSLAFPVESATTNVKASSVLANGAVAAVGSVAADVLPQNARDTAGQTAGQTTGPFSISSGLGPDLRSARAVLVVADPMHHAVAAVMKWQQGISRKNDIVLIADKEIRDRYTKDVRNDSHALFNLAGDGLLFVVGNMSMRPEGWVPAFDVIAMVNGDTYTLLKGRRAAVVPAAAPTAPSPAAVPAPSPAAAPPPPVDPAAKSTTLPSVNRILKSSLPDISRHKAVMFYGPDLRLTKFLVECIVYYRGAPTIPVEFATKQDRQDWLKKRSVTDGDLYRRRAIDTGYQVHVIVGWEEVFSGDCMAVDKIVRVHSDDDDGVQWSLVENDIVIDGKLEIGPA